MCTDFSVLLSVYHKEDPSFLSSSLNSIFSQILPPSEVVLVKDGALTETLDKVILRFCQQHPSLKVVSLQENQGLGRALNEGLKYCSHEIVARMDTDDIALPERFEKQIAILDTHPEIDLVGAWINEFNENPENITSTRKLPETHEEIYQFGKKRNPLNHPVVMFRKSKVLAAGSYLHFPLFEDYYLWVRMMLNRSKAYNIQEPLLLFRMSPEMFKRRGGFRYACNEVRFQTELCKLGYINNVTYLSNICIRFGTRIIPNNLRGWIYKKVLRK